MVPTGTSKGMITSLPTMSQAVTIAAPVRQTQGRLERRLSPLSRETMFGTTSPRKGRLPITTVMMPVTAAIIPVPSSTTFR